jgi:ketosteroid isomerase-like protein
VSAEHRNVELIRRFYLARAQGDRETVRALLHPEVDWHDPYPPPHGGDLHGADAVFRDVFDRAGELTGGTTKLWLESAFATDRTAVALVGWSSTYRGRTMRSREVAVYTVEAGQIREAWFHPEDPEAALAFFGDE